MAEEITTPETEIEQVEPEKEEAVPKEVEAEAPEEVEPVEEV